MRGTMIHSRPVPWWTALLMVGLLLALRIAPPLQYAPAWPRDSETAASWLSMIRPALPRGEVLADGTLRLGSQDARGELRLISAAPVLVEGSITASGPITLRAPQITIRGQLDAPAIHLESAGLLSLDPGARVRARVGVNGGPITVQAETLHLHGWLDANGQRGGPITLVAHALFQGGALTSEGQQGVWCRF